MKPLLFLLAACLCVGGSSAQEISAEKKAVEETTRALDALNAAFESGNAATIEKCMTPDHTAVTPHYGRPYDVKEILNSLALLKITEYKTGPKTIRLLGEHHEAAIVRYELTQQGTFDGKPLVRHNHVVAVFEKRDGVWREASYQETAAAK